MPGHPDPDGEPRAAAGCRPLLLTALRLIAFAAPATGSGLALITASACGGACETAGLVLYAAGAPISGLFSALAGGLPIAWPLDITLWLVVAGALSRRPSRGASSWRTEAPILILALAYGLAISMFIELA